MKRLTLSSLVCALPLALLSACGGGGSTVDSTPDTGAAQPGNAEGSITITASNVVNGRVADGYVRGATVCVDVNESGACDPDEPAAVTGNGGSYELEIPQDQSEKPIIANVPAHAIDEDTGEAIGKELILSTPHDRPEFISPITTLVHEELKGNPTLSTGDAEATVREELGLASDSGASLFTDYVASQNNGNGEDADHYRFLHQTARVVASMMDDIQERVESVATDGGLDLAGDAAAQEAIRKLVRQEVRQLLPEISLAVAEKINKQLEEPEGATPVSIVDEVDPGKVVESLRPADLETDVIDKIDAIRVESEVRKVAMEALLKEGIYWIDAECDDEQHHCFAEYGHISVTGDNNTFTEEQFEFDVESGTWIQWEKAEEDEPFALALKEGEWIAVNGDDTPQSVEFLADGGALLKTEQGTMVVYATAADLSNQPVTHHLRLRKASPELLEGVEESDLFPADSVAHRIHIKRQSEAHVLFNWAPLPFEDEAGRCDEFGGNCNVLESVDANGHTPIVALNDVIEGSAHGIEIAAVTQHQFVDQPLNVRLSTGADDGSESDTVVKVEQNLASSDQGLATWLLAPPAYEQTYPAPGECMPSGEPQIIKYPPIEYPEGENLPTEQPQGENFPIDYPAGQEPVNFEPDAQLPPCEYPQNMPADFCPDTVDPEFPEQCHVVTPVLADDAAAIAIEESIEPTDGQNKRVFATSRWKTVTVQGVKMIQIGLPVAVKQSIDIEEAGSMLLIEHDGYVRRGARLSDAGVSDELTYTLPALETLMPIVESYVNSSVQR